MNDIAEKYLKTWNASGTDRADLLTAAWSPSVSYVDPLAEVSGHSGMSAVIDGVHDQFPDFVFSRIGEVDAHHRQLRFRWGLGPAGAEPAIIGFDVIVLDEQGRIQDVRGFLDQVPA
ncbi:nuclear transport factor 2 family protein [Gordonia humi]|uniref:SnoaL-like domain-containing protein n=1 Tax=Gordonia humi TaxID=686429 RepID=A0A840F1R7_9ACTN|nr:nuclear transport factor 2 family protein [Gordonia humi]MBB4135319.1 hypothetical protein [Gordonia humi]